MGNFVVVVFFNEARTDYLAYGPLKTFEAADELSAKLLRQFPAGSVTTVITALHAPF